MLASSVVARTLHRRLARSSAPVQQQVRELAVPAPKTLNQGSPQQHAVFDRGAKAQQRSRAALAEDSRAYDYLRVEAADRLVDRLRVRHAVAKRSLLVPAVSQT